MAGFANLATASRTKLVSGLVAAKRTLVNIREQAEVGLQRMMIGGSAVGAGYGTGWVNGRGRRDGWKMTIGSSNVTWTQVGGAVFTIGGAFFGKQLGETISNVAFGAGVGTLAGEAALAGDRHGVAPPTP